MSSAVASPARAAAVRLRGRPARAVRGMLVAVLLPLSAAAVAQNNGPPSYASIRGGYPSSETHVVDRDGALLQRVRTDETVRRGRWTTLDAMSPALRTALLLSEDRNFYAHSGIDWSAVSAAAWGNLWHSRTRGASTITMQLAALLDDDLQRGPKGRSVGQKVEQAWAARLLEQSWRKDQILEAYLNLVPLRGELVGVDALARTLFDKAPHGLDAREAALTAALVRAPNASPAQVARRACELLREMERARTAADCEAIDWLARAALQRRAFAASEGIAPHAARRALAAAGAAAVAEGSVRTTLRAPLQRFAQATLQRHLRELQGRHVEDGAVVVLDNASGEVLAWIGSSGSLSRAAEVDGVLARRQPGSTLKPLLYAQALAERRLTAASLLDDSPAQIGTASGLYVPQNYDRQFKGAVSVRAALASSLNVPAVRTLLMVSPAAFARQLQAAGITLAQGGDYYGYSLALGSAEVSLLDLTNAYRTLANHGRHSAPRLLPAPQAAEAAAQAAAAIDPRASFIVGDILADANARARTFGADSMLATRFWSAVKTGTSKDMRDNWAVGWSERYTVGVWVGNAAGSPMRDVSGTSGAAPIWASLMGYLHRHEPSRTPAAPPGVVRRPVRFVGVAEADRDEWFIDGTAQPVFALRGAVQASTGQARIRAPADGTIIALDPDIPPAHQRLRFEADGERVRWLIDGRPFAQGRSARWLPWPGRHRISLVDARDGTLVDEIRLEVRGAGLLGRPTLPTGVQ